jgi:hypothetical protein
MAKGLIFAMNIGHEMLGALGQMELGVQVDDSRRSGPNGGILPRKELEIVKLALVHVHTAYTALKVISLQAGVGEACREVSPTFNPHYRSRRLRPDPCRLAELD